MRIAHVLSSFEVGGGETVALRLASAQQSAGNVVSVVGLAPGPMAERFTSCGIAVSLVTKKLGFDVTLYPRLATWFLRHRVQVVHTHNPQALVYATAAAKMAGATVIHTKHGEGADKARRLWLRRGAAMWVDAFVSVSQETVQYARNHREAARRKLYVIENGVDMTAFHPDTQERRRLRDELGVPHDTWLVGTVGRLAPVKNHQLLLEAVAPLLGDRTHLVLVGDGPERQALEELANARGCPDKVHFLGLRSDVARVMAGLDLFALSSLSEGLPLVLIEAMATGQPVVCTAVGGIPAVIEDGVTGLLVPSGDVEAMRAAVARLSNDHEAAALMGRNGRDRATQCYSLDRMQQQYMSLYETLRS